MQGRGPLGLVPATHHAPGPLVASRVAPPGRCRPAQLDVRGRPVGPPLRRPPRPPSRRAQRRPADVRHGLSRAVPRAMGIRPFCALGRADRAAKNTLGLVRAIRRLGLPLVIIGEPAPGLPGLCPRVPSGRRGARRLAGPPRPPRPRPGLGLRRGAGLRPAELVRDARPGRAGGGPGRLLGRDHPLRIHQGLFRRPGVLRAPGPARGDPACTQEVLG